MKKVGRRTITFVPSEKQIDLNQLAQALANAIVQMYLKEINENQHHPI